MKSVNKTHEEIIRDSHERSLSHGVERSRQFPRYILKDPEIAEILRSNAELISVSLPLINLLADFLKDSGFIIVLTDKAGCILHIEGDHDILIEAEKLNMVVGASMNEKSIGTNAMGIAIAEDSPVQVTAREHFINVYHKWTCSAAPVHGADHTLAGTLNLTGSFESVHPHTLGLVVAAVSSIEDKLINRANEKKLISSANFTNAILNSISFGVISLDPSGRILSSNNMANKLLHYPAGSLKGQLINPLLSNWENLYAIVSSNNIVLDEETQIETNSGPESFSLNAYPITEPDGEVTGMVLSFREMKRVYKIVNKYTGMNARYTFDNLIFRSKVMKQIVEFAMAIADSPSTILIQGESGSGKEVLAQAIHNHSNRAENGFVAVNCGAISATLIESELFGYEEGAFTGARKGGQPGKFELAHGGTLFLDEIGEMPAELQVKLLRVIQESVITRIGGSKQLPVDVRIIAATNKDLPEEVIQGRFRKDLYYRINVLPIVIPPLNQRKEDIPALAAYFLKTKSGKLGKKNLAVDTDFMQQFKEYSWPGNTRELENFIERYLAMNGKLSWGEFLNPPASLRIKSEPASFATPVSIQQLEKEAIKNTLRHFDNNVSRTARSLGISRNALYQKIRKYGITF